MTVSRPTISYVLTSRGGDFYSAMTRVSIASVRISNPAARVVIAVDALSLDRIKRAGDPLLDEADEVLDFPTPDGDDTFRNRYIKTNLRNLLEGPFLFLDSDIVVRRDLSGLFALQCDVAGAPNHSKDQLDEQIWNEDHLELVAMGWTSLRTAYLNGGVMLWMDTPGARSAAARWHMNWVSAYAQRGRYRDQPALNAALHDPTISVVALPHMFNAQFRTQLSVATGAAVWHYYSSQHEEPTTAFEIMVKRLLAGKPLKSSAMKAMVQRSHPWRRDALIDDWMAGRVVRTGQFGTAEAQWFAGRRLRSMRHLAGQKLRQLGRRLTGSVS